MSFSASGDGITHDDGSCRCNIIYGGPPTVDARPTSRAESKPSAASETPAQTELTHRRNFLGSAGIVATIAEAYLPYDLSHRDKVALRFYPIASPNIGVVGGAASSRPLMLRSSAESVVWSHSIEPSIAIQTHPVTQALTVNRRPADQALAAENLARTLARAAIRAIQPGSPFRETISPARLGWYLGDLEAIAVRIAARQARQTGHWIALRQSSDVDSRVLDSPRKTAGSRLLSRAEVRDLDLAEAQMAIEMKIASVTLDMPRAPQRSPEELKAEAARAELARAEAIATACDQFAATLEGWATAVRRAGDSVVRVAKSSAPASDTLTR